MVDTELRSTSNNPAPVSGLVAMIHVADVDRAAEFYRLLGFEIGNFVPPSGPKHWAWLYQPNAANWKTGANLMVTRTARPLHPDAQDVLFYLYATNLVELRDHLLAQGLKASEINYPEYLPNGEFGMQDPDGYCLMIAQSGPDTP